jgi:hypothetical protein
MVLIQWLLKKRGQKVQRLRVKRPGAAVEFWWRYRDSNPGPADYDSVALTD